MSDGQHGNWELVATVALATLAPRADIEFLISTGPETTTCSTWSRKAVLCVLQSLSLVEFVTRFFMAIFERIAILTASVGLPLLHCITCGRH